MQFFFCNAFFLFYFVLPTNYTTFASETKWKYTMKKVNVMLMALVAMLLLSCEEKKKDSTPDVTIVPVHEMPNICEAHGTIGDGSSMNVIEFVNDEGDTLYINKSGQAVMGGLVVGDELEVIYNVTKEDIYASVAVNLTALQHIWSQRGADGREQMFDVDAPFIAIGQIPQADIFESLVKLENGYVVAGEDCCTSAEGIFVAGDGRTKAVRQLTTAASDGAVAALAACDFIRSLN